MEIVPLNDLGRHNALLQQDLHSAAQNLLSSGWYVLGEHGKQFEAEFAAYCGVDHCIGTANGTDAIELALRALELGDDAIVATVANAGMYSTVAIRAAGAEPLFVDIESNSLCMDPMALRVAMQGKSKPDAVIVTHLYGQLADVESIAAICADAGVPLLEDCAQAHGAERNGRKAGSFGSMGCFSFYPTKNLGALGDAGAVVTSEPLLDQRLRQLRQYGWSSKYQAQVPGGRNSRLDEIQAAFLKVKLPHLDAWNQARRDIARRYAHGIVHPVLRLPPPPGRDSVVHLYVIRCDQREALREHLRKVGITSDIHYPVADHRQPCFGDRYSNADLPQSELACSRILTLPCFPEMTDTEVKRVIDACNAFQA